MMVNAIISEFRELKQEGFACESRQAYRMSSKPVWATEMESRPCLRKQERYKNQNQEEEEKKKNTRYYGKDVLIGF